MSYPCDLVDCSMPGLPVLHSLRICSDSYPLSWWYYLTISSSTTFSFCLQSFLASVSLQVSVSLCIRWPEYWRFSFSISSSSEYSWLISFRMDWLDLLAVQGTLKSLLQHHSSKHINSSALNFLYGPTLTSIHKYWKKHSFKCTDLCWQSDAFIF